MKPRPATGAQMNSLGSHILMHDRPRIWPLYGVLEAKGNPASRRCDLVRLDWLTDLCIYIYFPPSFGVKYNVAGDQIQVVEQVMLSRTRREAHFTLEMLVEHSFLTVTDLLGIDGYFLNGTSECSYSNRLL